MAHCRKHDWKDLRTTNISESCCKACDRLLTSVGDHKIAIVGIGAAKLRNAIALAAGGRDGEVRYFGEVEASAENMRRVVMRIAHKYDRVHF